MATAATVLESLLDFSSSSFLLTNKPQDCSLRVGQDSDLTNNHVLIPLKYCVIALQEIT